MFVNDPRAQDRLAGRIRIRLTALSPVQRRVAEFIAANPAGIADMTALDIGAAVGVSDASVVRTCHSLGFNGLSGLKRSVAQASGARPTQAGTLKAALDSANVDAALSVDMVLGHEGRLVANLQRAPARSAIVGGIRRLNGARRIMVFGTGTSGYLADYMAAMLTRHGRRARVLTASGFSLADQMLSLKNGDAILMLCFGSPYAEAEAVLDRARGMGAPLVVITENRHNPLFEPEDVVIEIRRVGPTGSPLHGATLICLEALLMGLAALEEELAVETLERLAQYREAVAVPSRGGGRKFSGRKSSPRRSARAER